MCFTGGWISGYLGSAESVLISGYLHRDSDQLMVSRGNATVGGGESVLYRCGYWKRLRDSMECGGMSCTKLNCLIRLFLLHRQMPFCGFGDLFNAIFEGNLLIK